MPDELDPRRETIEGLSAEVKQLSRKVDQLADLVNTFLEKLPGNAPAPIAKRTPEEKAVALPEYLTSKRRIVLPDERPVEVKEGGSKRNPPGGRRGSRGFDDDGGENLRRVGVMLEDIRKLLESLVHSKLPLPAEIQITIRESWPAADAGLQQARSELSTSLPQRKYVRLLADAGFTGKMLDLKESSLRFQKKKIEKAILSYDQKESFAEKIAKWMKPGFKVMNSILGSLSGIPGVEIAKEFKDHLESGYEVIEAGQPE